MSHAVARVGSVPRLGTSAVEKGSDPVTKRRPILAVRSVPLPIEAPFASSSPGRHQDNNASVRERLVLDGLHQAIRLGTAIQGRHRQRRGSLVDGLRTVGHCDTS